MYVLSKVGTDIILKVCRGLRLNPYVCQITIKPWFQSSAWLKGWKMIYCYPTLKVLKHEYRISRNAINFPASCMCSSTIKRFAKETFFVYIVHILHFTTDIIQRKMYIWTTFLQILRLEMELFAFLWHCYTIVMPI